MTSLDEHRQLIEMMIQIGTTPNISDAQERQKERVDVASRARRYEYAKLTVVVKDGKPTADRPRENEAGIEP